MQSDVTELIETSNDSCLNCASLGAMIAFSGLENCAKIVHGGPGCAAQIRRSLVRHFHEPVEIETSAVSDASAVLGGEANLVLALKRAAQNPSTQFVGVCATCLTETIGDNIGAILSRAGHILGNASAVYAQTPSYRNGLIDGFHNTVHVVIDQLVSQNDDAEKSGVNILPGLLSPADLRFLKELLDNFELEYTLLPDYSQTLDAPVSDEMRAYPIGGTSMSQIAAVSRRSATIEFVSPEHSGRSAGELIEKRFGIPNYQTQPPIGAKLTDRFLQLLSKIANTPVSEKLKQERGRLIASYIDARSITAGKRIAVLGGNDFCDSIASFLNEIGAIPLRYTQDNKLPEQIDASEPDLLIGNSSHSHLSDSLQIPIIRAGFPIYDRFGGQRKRYIGYDGAQYLFDEIVNALMTGV
jgi:nitrogenase molybdenum-iron protein NifN